MTIPTLNLSSNLADSKADITVYAVTKTKDGPVAAGFPVEKLLALGVTGAADQVVRAEHEGNAIALLGLGSSVTPAALRTAAGTAVRTLPGLGHIAFDLLGDGVHDAESLSAILVGAGLGSYSFTAYKQESPESRLAGTITVRGAHDDELISSANAHIAAVFLTRDLANTPPNDLSPERFAEIAVEQGEAAGLSVTVLDIAGLKAEQMGGHLAVGQGSSRGPRHVIVEWAPEGASRHVALVGKGITFDTGGLSLKPAASMQHMKFDMTGAASVLAVTIAAASLNLPVKVSAHLCLAENMPSGTATRPDDVITIRGGKTVEVTNTDAEGRLVLADGLVLAAEAKPDAIIDVATLTGAQRVALGDRYSGVMGNNEQLIQRVLTDGRAVGESLWPMPTPDELRPLLDSPVADIANAKIGNTAAGMLLASVFLREFIGNDANGQPLPWAHIDIAGPSTNNGSAWGFTPRGGTGVVVRGLIETIRSFSEEPQASESEGR